MSGMLVVDTRQLEKLSRDLKTFAKKAYPYAVREGLNRTALAAKNVWAEEIRGTMVLRNQWTVGSLRTVRVAGGQDPRLMVSKVGSLARYMGVQEDGGRKSKHGKHGVAIPTRVASGEGRGGGVRRRLVRGPNKLSAIQVPSRAGASRKQRNAIMIRRALASGKRFVFLQTERTKGLFRISGGKRSTRVDMVWDVSRASVRIPKNPTLETTLKRLGPHIVAIQLGALREQAARHRLFGY